MLPPEYSTLTQYVVDAFSVIWFAPLKVKDINVSVPVSVVESTLSEVANAEPVGNPPDSAYIFDTTLPVGDPDLYR